MYGMLLESIQHYIKEKYGEEKWRKILENSGIKNMVFNTHTIYRDDVMVNIAKSCCKILRDKSQEEYMNYFGQCFVLFFSNYGYDKVVRVAGRHYRNFLHEIDNLHEMMRYCYPRLLSPSFFVQSEDKNGCILTYRSKRNGFKSYVIGQLVQCAKLLYNVDVDIFVLMEEFTDSGCKVTFRLNFDNQAYLDTLQSSTSSQSLQDFTSISTDTFFRVFPFCILFDNNMEILRTGSNMTSWLGTTDLTGESINVRFKLRRPLLDFTWNNVMSHQSVIYELQFLSLTPCNYSSSSMLNGFTIDSPQCDQNSGSKFRKIIFRGQMKYINAMQAMAFLCNPLVGSLEDMSHFGLYINELNLFDNSREMVMAGWQHASQLEFSLEQQKEKSLQTTENMKQLDEWRCKSNALLYSMIPETIAKRLKNGEDPISTCETFDQVTIMFSYIVGFTDICAQASAMQIVQCINSVFTCFDAVVDKYDVFKVETLGDAVYMVAGGVPDRNPNHAENVAGLALELVEKATSLIDPVTGEKLQLRTGMHTGGVVGGIIGKRMPQYCLFGDTVNTASRMQSYSEPGRVHLSEPCYECLKGRKFVSVFRGTVNVKGKGEMKTYWLAGKEGEAKTIQLCEKLRAERTKKLQTQYKFVESKPYALHCSNSFENGFDLHGMHSSTSAANFTMNLPTAEDRKTKESGPGKKLLPAKSKSQLFADFPEEDDDEDEASISQHRCKFLLPEESDTEIQ